MPTDETYPLKKPLDPLTVEAIRHVVSAGRALGIDVMLCGAQARVLILEHLFGNLPSRNTTDVDFAFAIDSWHQYGQLKASLEATGLWQRGKRAHDLHPAKPGQSMPIDLVPFGVIANAQGDIEWPPKREIVMSVVGFSEAHEAALRVEIEPDLLVSVVSVPGTAMLKLVAWHDRLTGEGGDKHAGDFAQLLKIYGNPPHNSNDRVYDLPESVRLAAGFDDGKCGAWLLGNDVARIAKSLTREKLSQVFTRNDRLVRDVTKASHFKHDIDLASEYVDFFWAGYDYAVAEDLNDRIAPD